MIAYTATGKSFPKVSKVALSIAPANGAEALIDTDRTLHAYAMPKKGVLASLNLHLGEDIIETPVRLTKGAHKNGASYYAYFMMGERSVYMPLNEAEYAAFPTAIVVVDVLVTFAPKVAKAAVTTAMDEQPVDDEAAEPADEEEAAETVAEVKASRRSRRSSRVAA